MKVDDLFLFFLLVLFLDTSNEPMSPRSRNTRPSSVSVSVEMVSSSRTADADDAMAVERVGLAVFAGEVGDAKSDGGRFG